MKKILIFVVLLFGVDMAFAMSLQEALEKAYDFNPKLKAEQEKLKEEDERIMRALGSFMPTVQVNKKSTFNNIKNYTSNSLVPRQTSTNISQGIAVKQNVFRSFGDISELAKQKNLVLLARANLKAAEQETLFEAAQAYLNVVKAKETRDITDKKVKSYRTLVESMKEKFKAGEVTRTDVSQAEARYSQAISDNIAAVGSVKSAQAKFKSVIGEEAGELEMPTLRLELPVSVDDAFSISTSKNPNVEKAKYSKNAGNNGIAVARANLLPSADVEFSRTRADTTITNAKNSYTNTTTLSVTMPLFNGGRNWSGLRSAKRAAKGGEYQYKNTINSIYDTTMEAWQNFEISKASLAAREDALEYAKIAWEGMQIEEQAGTRDTTDVIISQANYFDTLIQLLNEKVNYRIRYYALKAQLGEMTAKDLELQVNYYDPLKNYDKITKELIGSF
ncbi:MAG: TolC family outer membrane protein [Rickettsiales bacterium]